jgi:hypothetical protein
LPKLPIKTGIFIMSKPTITIKIDITSENFPRSFPALQGFVNEAVEDASAWIETQDFPDDIKASVLPVVLSSLLRDAIYKLQDGISQYTGMTSGQITHFIEGPDGQFTPAHIKPREGTDNKAKFN